MAAIFQVTPEYLEQQATVTEGQYVQYKTIWQRIYTEKDQLQQYWKGEANLAFCTQLEGFRNDFENLSKVLTDLVAFIRDAAKKYRTTDQALAGQAKTISTGI